MNRTDLAIGARNGRGFHGLLILGPAVKANGSELERIRQERDRAYETVLDRAADVHRNPSEFARHQLRAAERAHDELRKRFLEERAKQ